jgi:choline kinase
MRLIILSAGDSFELDGFNKLLIKNPMTGKTIIEQYQSIFEPKEIIVVVGYKAMEIMNQYPNFKYIYNKKWQTTGSAYSLSLVLNEEPTIVIESDFFINDSLKTEFENKEEFVVIKNSESKSINSFKAILNQGFVSEVYSGKANSNDRELLGIFKISNQETLRQWKKNGIQNPHQYIGESFPYETSKVPFIEVSGKSITEINTPIDFINFINNDDE